MKIHFLLLAVLLATSACKKDKDDGPIPSQSVLDLSGNWSGTYASDQSSSTPVTATFNQNTATITGTFNISSGASTGTVSGTAGTSSALLTITQTTPCAGSYSGTATRTGNQMTVRFSGVDCGAPVTNGIAVLNKI